MGLTDETRLFWLSGLPPLRHPDRLYQA